MIRSGEIPESQKITKVQRDPIPFYAKEQPHKMEGIPRMNVKKPSTLQPLNALILAVASEMCKTPGKSPS